MSAGQFSIDPHALGMPQASNARVFLASAGWLEVFIPAIPASGRSQQFCTPTLASSSSSLHVLHRIKSTFFYLLHTPTQCISPSSSSSPPRLSLRFLCPSATTTMGILVSFRSILSAVAPYGPISLESSDMAACSTKCFTEADPSPCKENDVACLCLDKYYFDQVSKCVTSCCSEDDAKKAEEAAIKECKAAVRRSRSSMLNLSLTHLPTQGIDLANPFPGKCIKTQVNVTGSLKR